MNKSHKDTIRKIRKLMRMAERGGTLEEAQNALERIREIMARYNLSMQDVEKFKEDDCAEEFVRVSTKYVPGYMKLLVNAMNLLFQCESAFISDRIKNCHNITFIGVGADPLIASQTFVFLLEFARRKLKERKISVKEKEDYLLALPGQYWQEPFKSMRMPCKLRRNMAWCQ